MRVLGCGVHCLLCLQTGVSVFPLLCVCVCVSHWVVYCACCVCVCVCVCGCVWCVCVCVCVCGVLVWCVLCVCCGIRGGGAVQERVCVLCKREGKKGRNPPWSSIVLDLFEIPACCKSRI